MGQRKPLSGKKILIVEDDFLMAEELLQLVRRADCDRATAFASVRSALAALANEDFDGALLDGHLQDGMSTDVARQLVSRRIPFIVVTGYLRDWLPSELRDAPYLAKPVDPEVLIELAARHFSRY